MEFQKRLTNHKSGAIYGIPSAMGMTAALKHVHVLRGTESFRR